MSQAGQADLAAALGLEVFEFGPLGALYRPIEAGAWKLAIGANVPCRGYWSELKLMRELVVLTRGANTWMSLTPIEYESQILGVEAAQGHVVIHGLGMGWVAAETALREAVSAITIVERDADVIALHQQLDLFARLPDGVGAKMRIVHADAFEWQPDGAVDFLMPDIWLPLVGDPRLPDVRRMQEQAQSPAIYFWGQELEIARYAAAAGLMLDEGGVKQTVRDFDLPVILPDTPDYPGKIRAAARQWMRDRWFDPSHVVILDDPC